MVKNCFDFFMFFSLATTTYPIRPTTSSAASVLVRPKTLPRLSPPPSSSTAPFLVRRTRPCPPDAAAFAATPVLVCRARPRPPRPSLYRARPPALDRRDVRHTCPFPHQSPSAALPCHSSRPGLVRSDIKSVVVAKKHQKITQRRLTVRRPSPPSTRTRHP